MEIITQDANKVIDKLNFDWASDMAKDKKRIAILMEENERLKAEKEALEKRNEELRSQLKKDEKETDE